MTGQPLSEDELAQARERVEGWLYTQGQEDARARHRLWAGVGLGFVLLAGAAWLIRLPPRSERVPPPEPARSVVEVPVVGPVALSARAVAHAQAQVEAVCGAAGAPCEAARQWQERFVAKDCAGARAAAFDALRAGEGQTVPVRAALGELEALAQQLCARRLFVPAPSEPPTR